MAGPAAAAAAGTLADNADEVAKAGGDAAKAGSEALQESEGLNALLILAGLGLAVAYWRLSSSAADSIDGANDAARGIGDAVGTIFDGGVDAARGTGDVVDNTIDGYQDTVDDTVEGAQHLVGDAGDTFGGLVP